jgi:hypothetical protein
MLPLPLAVSGQQRPGLEGLPRFRINSAEDVAIALASAGEGDWGLRAAIVALEGRRASLYVRQLLRNPDVSDLVKERAMGVATYTRDSLLANELLHLAQRDSGLLGVRAWESLPLLPFATVCQQWRTLLTGSRDSHKRTLAVIGLGYCGSQEDVPWLERLRGDPITAGLRDDVVAALARIQQPLGDRFDRAVWAPGPFGNGDFVPGPELAALIQRRVCGGPCSASVMLDPRQPFP